MQWIIKSLAPEAIVSSLDGLSRSADRERSIDTRCNQAIGLIMSNLYRSTLRRTASTIPQKRAACSLCIRHFSIKPPQRDLEHAQLPADSLTPPPASPALTTPNSADETLPQSLATIIQEDSQISSRKRHPVANHDRTAGTVVGAGKMSKTVKVKFVKQHWNLYLRKVSTIPLDSCPRTSADVSGPPVLPSSLQYPCPR